MLTLTSELSRISRTHGSGALTHTHHSSDAHVRCVMSSHRPQPILRPSVHAKCPKFCLLYRLSAFAFRFRAQATHSGFSFYTFQRMGGERNPSPIAVAIWVAIASSHRWRMVRYCIFRGGYPLIGIFKMAQRQHDECRIGRGYAGGERMPKKSRQKLLLGSRTALLTVSAVRPEISQGSLCNVLFCGM